MAYEAGEAAFKRTRITHSIRSQPEIIVSGDDSSPAEDPAVAKSAISHQHFEWLHQDPAIDMHEYVYALSVSAPCSCSAIGWQNNPACGRRVWWSGLTRLGDLNTTRSGCFVVSWLPALLSRRACCTWVGVGEQKRVLQ